MKKISCIIPAYNEEARIEGVLSVIQPLIGKHIYEVIVVDDGSYDDTKQVVKNFPQINLIIHEVNKGKNRTVADGIRASKGDYIFLLDADLKSLREQNIIDLVNPIEKDLAKVTISFRKNGWPLFPFKKIDYLSGERILPKFYLMEKINEMESLPSYSLEVFINRIIIKNKLSLKIVHWPEVENVFNQDKMGWKKGVKFIVTKIWWRVICETYFFGMYYQNIKMAKLLVK